MFCENCGKEITSEMDYCPYCGAENLNSDSVRLAAAERLMEEQGYERQAPPRRQAQERQAAPRRQDYFEYEREETSPKKTYKLVIGLAVILALFVVGGLGGYLISSSMKKKSGKEDVRKEAEDKRETARQQQEEKQQEAEAEKAAKAAQEEAEKAEEETQALPSAEDAKEEEKKEEEKKEPDSWSKAVFPDSSERYLSESEVASLSKDRLRIAINEIYARHGYKFNSADLAEYFKDMPGYTPSESDQTKVSSRFNAYEKANIDLLVKYRD